MGVDEISFVNVACRYYEFHFAKRTEKPQHNRATTRDDCRMRNIRESKRRIPIRMCEGGKSASIICSIYVGEIAGCTSPYTIPCYESISSYELVACGPISRPNISSLTLPIFGLRTHITDRHVGGYALWAYWGNPHGETAWKQAPGVGTLVHTTRWNKKRSRRKQVTAGGPRTSITYLYLSLIRHFVSSFEAFVRTPPLIICRLTCLWVKFCGTPLRAR